MMKNDFVMPILILTLICFVVSGALAATNALTEPIITADAAERAEQAKIAALPDATGFYEVVIDELPDSVREIYASENDVGYVFTLVTRGYGGDITIICGIDNEGKLLTTNVLSHSETSGIGSKITEPQFTAMFIGADSELEGVSAVTGATISTTAYINAIEDAFTALEMVMTNP